MKISFFLSLVLFSTLSAAEITLLPYVGTTINDRSNAKSLKNATGYFGLYASYIEEQNQFDFAYSYSKTLYKSRNVLSDFDQQDFTAKYTQRLKDTFFSIGLHSIHNTENDVYTDLGSGYIGFIGFKEINQYNNKNISYGIDTYYSLYTQAHGETSRSNTIAIAIAQFSPYYIYSIDLSPNMRNDFTLRANAISAAQYTKISYLSAEVINTTYFNNTYLILHYLGGKMRSGITNEGFTVYNNKDLYSGIYNISLGYCEVNKLTYDVSYALSTFREFNPDTLVLLPKGISSTILGSVRYQF